MDTKSNNATSSTDPNPIPAVTSSEVVGTSSSNNSATSSTDPIQISNLAVTRSEVVGFEMDTPTSDNNAAWMSDQQLQAWLSENSDKLGQL